jgi:hypothetical protein
VSEHKLKTVVRCPRFALRPGLELFLVIEKTDAVHALGEFEVPEVFSLLVLELADYVEVELLIVLYFA